VDNCEEEAAQIALEIQRDANSMAEVFEVVEYDSKTETYKDYKEIDLREER
jgi:hypothetical protein